MELKVPFEELRKRKIFLATPMYGGQCAGIYCRSVVDLSAMCAAYGIGLQIHYLFNESLITRARAYCCDEFMRSDCTHLMFIDSDIGFDANHVLTLLAMMSDDSPYDVLAAPYPKKCISWEKIKAGVDKGYADEDPNRLENLVGDFVFNPVSGAQQIPIGEPCQVREAGTGFMMIRRATFEKYKETYPHKSYRPDHVRTEHFDGTREIMMYFDCEIEPETKRYLSEDYQFCYNVWKMGMQVWFCPWMKLIHMGSYMFGGSLADLAAVGVAATADASLLKKNRSNKVERFVPDKHVVADVVQPVWADDDRALEMAIAGLEDAPPAPKSKKKK